MADRQFPPALKRGDRIGVFAPSSWVEKDDIEKSTSLLKERGYDVFIHPQTYEREHQSAGSNLQKCLAFQGLWQRKDINAIWTAGGGNRCMHFLENVNFNRLSLPPKPVIGFSDVTALLNTLFIQRDIISYHGPVFKNLHKYNMTDHLFGVLEGCEHTTYPVHKDNILRDGQSEGILIGGNLSLIQYQAHILAEHDLIEGAILFIEDCNEELSKLDRMLLHLKRTGLLNKLGAIVFGQFTNMIESGRPFGYTLRDLIIEHTSNLEIPVLYDMPFGHGNDLYTMPIGVKASLDTEKLSFSLSEKAVAQPSTASA